MSNKCCCAKFDYFLTFPASSGHGVTMQLLALEYKVSIGKFSPTSNVLASYYVARTIQEQQLVQED